MWLSLYPRMLWPVFWSQVEYKIVSFTSMKVMKYGKSSMSFILLIDKSQFIYFKNRLPNLILLN